MKKSRQISFETKYKILKDLDKIELIFKKIKEELQKEIKRNN
jgi:hypothetical protein